MTNAPHATGREQRPGSLKEQVLTCLGGTWRSLVVVPAEPGESALPVAQALAEALTLVDSRPSKLFAAEDLAIGATAGLIMQVMDHVERGGVAIISVDAVVDRRAAVPVFKATDAALLCVHLGSTTLVNAKRTVALVGREQFIGAVTVEPPR